MMPNAATSTSINDRPALLKEYESKLEELLTSCSEDISERIYSKELIHLVRDVHKSFHFVPCPMTEEELQKFGIDRGTMPPPKPVEYKSQAKGKSNGVSAGPAYGLSSNKKFMEKSYNRSARKLHRCRNPWKRVFYSSHVPSSTVEAKIEKITKSIRGILNKITPSTYEELSMEIVEKQIWNDPDILPAVVDLIISKASQDQVYVKIYAELCLDLFAAEESDVFDQCRFLKALAKRCQIGLNSTVANCDKEILELQNKIEHEYQMSKKKRMEQDLEEMKVLKKRRSQGILRFIAHLCRVPIFHFETIQNCFCRLIAKSKASKIDYVVMIEFATFFLSVVGPHVVKSDDHEDQLLIINLYVSYLVRQKPILPNRIKCLIMNLEGLRANGWTKMVKKSESAVEQLGKNREAEVEKGNKENSLLVNILAYQSADLKKILNIC